MQAKKSFGQHFLNQPDMARRIAEGLLMTAEHPFVLEVGPGQGMLTQFLVDKPFKLLVSEADRDMVPILEKKFAALRTPLSIDGIEAPKSPILFGDFLQVDLEAAFCGRSFCLIGNFPYNISSQIVIKMLDNRHLIPEMVGMFQKEVADRIVSKPGTKDYGVLSVLTQAFYEGKTIMNVDKSCFSPPPKVQSAVIRGTRKDNQDLGCDERLFKRVVKQAFSQRRKMLRNTLKPFFDKDPAQLNDDFYMKRPETLSVADFVALTQLIERVSAL